MFPLLENSYSFFFYRQMSCHVCSKERQVATPESIFCHDNWSSQREENQVTCLLVGPHLFEELKGLHRSYYVLPSFGKLGFGDHVRFLGLGKLWAENVELRSPLPGLPLQAPACLWTLSLFFVFILPSPFSLHLCD